MSTHTPGPWVGRLFAGNIDLIAGKFPYQVTVATVYNLDPEDDANARLIAAAPELLDQLRAVAIWLIAPTLDKGTVQRIRSDCLDVIAKAETKP